MTDAGLKISIIYTSVPDFFLCVSYNAWIYNQQSNYSVSVKTLQYTFTPWEFILYSSLFNNIFSLN